MSKPSGADWRAIVREFDADEIDMFLGAKILERMAKGILKLRAINEQQAEIIRDNKWDELVEQIANLSEENAQLRETIKDLREGNKR